jgi:hypothetical protein
MKTKQVQVYEFNELSPEAKEKARQWWRNVAANDNFYAEDVLEDADQIAEILGIEIDRRQVPRHDDKFNERPKIWYSGFSSQGDGACFEGVYRYKPDAVAKIQKYAPQDKELHRIAVYLESTYKEMKSSFSVKVTHSGRYYHERMMDFDVFPDDEEDTETVDSLHESIAEVLRDFAKWIYRSLEASYDATQTDEYIDEVITINEYKFLVDGSRRTI